ADEQIDRARMHLRPPTGRDRLADDLLLGVLQHVGDVQPAGDLNVHAGGDVRLGVEIDHEGADAAGEGGGSETESHGRLPDASFEGADAEYVHVLHVTVP